MATVQKLQKKLKILALNCFTYYGKEFHHNLLLLLQKDWTEIALKTNALSLSINIIVPYCIVYISLSNL